MVAEGRGLEPAAGRTEPSPLGRLDELGSFELDDLLRELRNRASSARAAHGRLGALLDAVVAIGSDLELSDVLSRITRSACSLTDAKYGALGVLDADGEHLVEFITTGITDEERAAIGHPPRGHGVLGLLIRDPRPRRVRDIQSHEESYGFPANHPAMHSFLGAPIRVRDEVFGNLYLAEKQGADEFSEVDESVVVALAAAASIAIDNARLYDTSRRRAQASAAVGDLTHAQLADEDAASALPRLVRAAAALADAERVGVVLTDGRGHRTLVTGAPAPRPGSHQVPDPAPDPAPEHVLDGAVWAALERTREPVLLSGYASPTVVNPVLAELARALGASPTGTAAVLNLATGDQDVGLLVVMWDGPAGLEAEAQLPDLADFARHIGLALMAGQTRRSQARLSLLDDRERIARDMHDHVIQRLFATGLSLQTASQAVEEVAARDRIDEAIDSLDAAIREIRMAIFQLNQSSESGALTTLLRQTLAAFARGLGFAPTLTLTGDVDGVPADERDDILAVVREGLSNTMRHAHATTVAVSVDVSEGLCVTITDNGVGLEPSHARSGLINLSGRASRRGGRLDILPGSPGATLRWVTPARSAAPGPGPTRPDPTAGART